jgi:hypothetical protein
MLFFSAGLLGIAATAAAPTATSSPAQLAQLQYLELTRMQLIDDRCHWLPATARVALDATAAERKAWLQDKAPGQTTSAAEVESNTKQANAVVCTDTNLATGVRYGAWQMRITWTLRAQALLDGNGRPAWFSQQSPVLPYRKTLEETLAALNEKYGSSIENSRPGIEQEAVQMLALACPSKPHQCPAGETSGYGRNYAQAWVQQSARFAEALAKDPVKLPPIPS